VAEDPDGTSLRTQSLRGAAYLAGRQAVGVLLRLGGVLVVTRMIGPDDYGVFAASLVIVTVLASVAQLGAEVFLIRSPDAVDRAAVDATASFLVVTSTVIAVAAVLGAQLARPFLGDPDIVRPLQVMALVLPVNVCWAPAQAIVERAFAYRRMAALELAGDLALYATAVPLALAGAGVWAPVAGYAAWQAVLLVGSYLLARHRPRWRWDPGHNRALTRYGVAFSATVWAQRAGEALLPLVVGSTAGAAAVGHLALATRLVDTLGFAHRAAYRLAIVAFARVQHERDRLGRALEEGMVVQAVALGVPLAGFAVVARPAVSAMFGPDWQEAVGVLPWVALAFSLRSLAQLRGNVLQVLGRQAPVVVAAWTFTAASTVLALLIVPWAGPAGVGVAQVLALPAWLLLEPALRARVSGSLRRVLPWLVASIPPMFVPLAGSVPVAVALVAPALAVPLLPGPRAELVGWVDVLRRRRRRADRTVPARVV
jgi:O-antigen/teichoic acid export membrane protein